MEGQGAAGISAMLQAKPRARRQVGLKGLSNPVTIVQINSRAGDAKAN
jgi:hypothetical protein